MVKIIDIRNRTKRTNGTRKLSLVKNIARHHSATATGNFDSFWDFWSNTRGWGTGGYHEIILRDGSVELCYGPEEITNGVANTNTSVYNICLVGNGTFTEAQERTFDIRAKAAMKLFGLPVSAVKGHGEFAGASTTCPGINMAAVRNRLSGSGEVIQTSKPSPSTSKPSTSKLAIDGSWGPAVTRDLQRFFKTIVDGVISGQPNNASTRNIPSAQYGSSGSDLIRAMQRFYGTTADGKISGTSNLIKAMQRKYGLKIVDGYVSLPSNLVKEIQRRLNNGTL